jgi:hypothetical protein
MELERKEQQRANELLSKTQRTGGGREKRPSPPSRSMTRPCSAFYVLLAVGASLLGRLDGLGLAHHPPEERRPSPRRTTRSRASTPNWQRRTTTSRAAWSMPRPSSPPSCPPKRNYGADLPQSFLLYKPLDIVSGDLPFVKRIGDKLFVAAIDCTGHGVPAAMMTFIAYYGLSDLLAQEAGLNCGQILDKLHLHVKGTMEARGEESLYNDGFLDVTEGGDLLDTDGDGIPNRFNLDSDNDGIYDVVEAGSGKSQIAGVLNSAVNAAGIPISVDADANYIVDYTVKDSDGDGNIDSAELDSNGDGCLDVTEAGFIDTNGDGTPGHAPIAVNANGVVTSLTP